MKTINSIPHIAASETQSGYIISEDAEYRIKKISEALETMGMFCLCSNDATNVEIQPAQIAPIFQTMSWALGDLVKDLPFSHEIKLKSH